MHVPQAMRKHGTSRANNTATNHIRRMMPIVADTRRGNEHSQKDGRNRQHGQRLLDKVRYPEDIVHRRRPEELVRRGRNTPLSCSTTDLSQQEQGHQRHGRQGGGRMTRGKGFSRRRGLVVAYVRVGVEFAHVVKAGTEVAGIILDAGHDKDLHAHGQQIHTEGRVKVSAGSKTVAHEPKDSHGQGDRQEIEQRPGDGFIVVIGIGKGQIDQGFAIIGGLVGNRALVGFDQMICFVDLSWFDTVREQLKGRWLVVSEYRIKRWHTRYNYN